MLDEGRVRAATKIQERNQFRTFLLGSSQLRRTSFAASIPDHFLLSHPGISGIQERNQFRLLLFLINDMGRRQRHPPYYNRIISGPQENR